jgi:ankyrin repeat protein
VVGFCRFVGIWEGSHIHMGGVAIWEVPDPIDKEAAEALLNCAIKTGSEKMVRLLLSGHKIDPNCRSTGLLTPLMIAIEAGRAGRSSNLILQLLLDTEGIKPALRDEKRRAALLLAASLEKERALDMILVSTAVNSNCKDYDCRAE